jgi:hypothetical protein
MALIALPAKRLAPAKVAVRRVSFISGLRERLDLAVLFYRPIWTLKDHSSVTYNLNIRARYHLFDSSFAVRLKPCEIQNSSAEGSTSLRGPDDQGRSTRRRNGA